MSQDLSLYCKYADRLLATFHQWKDIDRFYFIPVSLNMAFYLDGRSTAMAAPPYFIGTILRNSLEHPALFGTLCQCGFEAYSYSFNGSPLSGRVDQSHACPHCGRHTATIETGWKSRSKTLHASQKSDKLRLAKTKLLHPRLQHATIQELLKCIGLSDEELMLKE